MRCRMSSATVFAMHCDCGLRLVVVMAMVAYICQMIYASKILAENENTAAHQVTASLANQQSGYEGMLAVVTCGPS